LEEIITLSNSILDLLYIEGYDHMESIARKTKTLARICGDDDIDAWLHFELSGSTDAQTVENTVYDYRILKKGYSIFRITRAVQDRGSKSKLLRKVYNRLESDKPIDELRSEISNLPYTSGVPSSLKELVDFTREGFDIYGAAIRRNVYWEIRVLHEDYKMILNRVKSKINDYVTGVNTEALRLRDSRKKRLLLRVKYIWRWVERNKIYISIGFIAAVITILWFILALYGVTPEEAKNYVFSLFGGK
jgi:hypothetical protein